MKRLPPWRMQAYAWVKGSGLTRRIYHAGYVKGTNGNKSMLVGQGLKGYPYGSIWVPTNELIPLEDTVGIKRHPSSLLDSARKNPMRRKRNPRSAPTCKMCGGPKMILGSLGWTRHFRCRDCGAESSQQVRRPKPRKKNPASRRASTKRILSAWMRSKSGVGSMKLHRKAARRMGLKASMFIRKNKSRRTR